jgi:hypothetical protein
MLACLWIPKNEEKRREGRVNGRASRRVTASSPCTALGVALPSGSGDALLLRWLFMVIEEKNG